MKQLVKHPAVADYFGADFSPQTTADDTIASAPTWTVPAGLTRGTEGFALLAASIKLSGGTLGATYVVRCEATMTSGRTLVVEFELTIMSVSS